MASNSPSITLLIPVLNEIEGLQKIFPQIDRSLVDDILFVDGGSTDGTLEYVNSLGVRIYHQKMPGLGAAVLEAMDHITTDFVIEFSPDGNCQPEDLAPLVAKIHEGNDLVVVSRYLPPAKSYDDTIVTAFGNFVFSKLISIGSRTPITDALMIYRGFRKNLFITDEFRHFLYGPVFEPLITMWASSKKYKIAEIPGDEPLRLGGEKKMRVLYNGSMILIMIFRMYLYRLGIKI